MKKIFWLLTFILIWLINFWYCTDQVVSLLDTDTITNKSINNSNLTTIFYAWNYISNSDKTICIKWTNSDSSFTNWLYVWVQWNETSTSLYNTINYYNANFWKYLCLIFSPWDYLRAKTMAGSSNSFNFEIFVLNDLLDENLPELTSQQCQSKYWLVDPSNIHTEIRVLENNNETTTYYLWYWKYATIDLNWNDYIQYPLNWNYTFVIDSNNNWNCTWSIITWDIQWSALYINQIQHVSAPVINIDIPEEFNWDYTNEDDEFNLSIEWYNVDTEYIDWIIRTQNYKPTTEDFTNLVWMLTPYSKYLLFLLFIFIIWAWLKKPFKSKKL